MQTEIEGDKDIIIFISIRTTSLDLYKLLKELQYLAVLRNLENLLPAVLLHNSVDFYEKQSETHNRASKTCNKEDHKPYQSHFGTILLRKHFNEINS